MALFPVEVPAKQDESDTPVGVWHGSGLLPTLGNHNTTGRQGGASTATPVPTRQRVDGGEVVPRHPRAGGAPKTQGAAAGVALVTAQGTAAREVAKCNGLNRIDSGAVIRWGRRKWWDVGVRQAEHHQPQQAGQLQTPTAVPVVTHSSPTHDLSSPSCHLEQPHW